MKNLTFKTIFSIAIVSFIFVLEGCNSGKKTEGKVVNKPSGLQYVDVVIGTGPEVQVGAQVSVHYTGWLEDKTKFDSSKDRGEPFSFVVGQGQVIKGWDEGLVGMKVGGTRKLVIPAQLGYGSNGAGGVIPPNATLIFEIELLKII